MSGATKHAPAEKEKFKLKLYKFAAAALAAGLLLLAVGCSKKEPAAEQQIANPVAEQQSLEAANNAAGTHLVQAEGATGEQFSTISGDPVVAQYQFTLDGQEYTFRAAKTTQDISGVWEEGKTLGDRADELSGSGSVFVMAGEDFHWARWFDGEVQYSLYTGEMDANTFADVELALHTASMQ